MREAVVQERVFAFLLSVGSRDVFLKKTGSLGERSRVGATRGGHAPKPAWDGRDHVDRRDEHEQRAPRPRGR